MTWLDLPRVPEPEVMDDSNEVRAYSSASAEAYLSTVDDSFVEHALRLIGSASGWAIDLGCGPGQIVRKLSVRLPQWKFVGVDRSQTMIRGAVETSPFPGRSRDLEAASSRVRNTCFLLGDANSLPFPDASFDLILSNSVLHHIGDPARLLAEIRRVARPEAAILLRDLRRPSRIGYPFHVRWHGRHYEGLMYKLYCDSVHAAYTCRELTAMLRSAGIPGARLFTQGFTHLGIERGARRAA